MLGGVRRTGGPAASHDIDGVSLRKGLRLNLHAGAFLFRPSIACETSWTFLTADEPVYRSARRNHGPLDFLFLFLLLFGGALNGLFLFFLFLTCGRRRRFRHSHHVLGNRVGFLLLGILG